jgi:hypothetical protein
VSVGIRDWDHTASEVQKSSAAQLMMRAARHQLTVQLLQWQLTV